MLGGSPSGDSTSSNTTRSIYERAPKAYGRLFCGNSIATSC